MISSLYSEHRGAGRLPRRLSNHRAILCRHRQDPEVGQSSSGGNRTPRLPPWQNAWIESFNGRLRDEYLNGQIFESLLEAQGFTEDWRIDYSMRRPHSTLRGLTPIEFNDSWTIRNQPQLA